MAKVKISALPEATNIAASDLLTAVSSSVSTKITVQNLSNNLTQVSSSISASYSVTSSYAQSGLSSSYSVSSSYARSSLSSSYSITASYALNAGGGSTTPGGSNGQLQYNNSSTFGGVSKATFDGTNLTLTGSFSGSLVGNLTGTSSWSSNSVTASFVQTAQTASFVATASWSSNSVTSSFIQTAQTASYVLQAVSASFSTTASSVNTLTQNVTITGSLIVSGANGAGIFSQGGTISDYSTGISNSGSYMVWRAPFSCSVVAMYGYREGGSAANVNAARSGSSGYGLLSGSDLSLASSNTWLAFNSVQNANFNAGDTLKVIMSGSANNQIAVQVDFIRKT